MMVTALALLGRAKSRTSTNHVSCEGLHIRGDGRGVHIEDIVPLIRSRVEATIVIAYRCILRTSTVDAQL